MSLPYCQDLDQAYPSRSEMSENNFLVVSNGIETNTGRLLQTTDVHANYNTRTMLENTNQNPFQTQREGLSAAGRGKQEKDDTLFFKNYILFRGLFYYPYIENNIYYYPRIHNKNIYYYPMSATAKCFCEDEYLNYRFSVSPNVSGRCETITNCQKCNLDYYFMCQNEFPTSG